MFTTRKLLKLPYKTRLRKLVLILQQAERRLTGGDEVDFSLLGELAGTISSDAPPDLGGALEYFFRPEGTALRRINHLRHALLRSLGAEPAEWDFLLPGSERLNPDSRRVFPFSVYLEDIRSPFNVGSLFRTAESFGVESMWLSPSTPLPTHKKAARTARGAGEVLPWQVGGLDDLPAQPAVFALETGGLPLKDFDFPPAGLVLIGSEELGLSPEALKLADRSAGRVEIPLVGAKRSLNVSVAFGILMQHWLSRIQK